ncbi:hypothetical protein BKA66DRAFT_292424 [Pyrenochaeta sp. MPI-SDFR-AT-0127]|nr:hypothetical protein BKA66DRAFT_292424 [Pyrenochaeta sp. MPI-SDFR-AT-0127]
MYRCGQGLVLAMKSLLGWLSSFVGLEERRLMVLVKVEVLWSHVQNVGSEGIVFTEWEEDVVSASENSRKYTQKEINSLLKHGS